MKKLQTIFVAFLLVMGAVNLTSAAYLDIVPNQPDPLIVNPGDPFHVDIYLTGNASEILNGAYQFDIAFDTNELALLSDNPLSATEFWPPGWIDVKPLSFNPSNNHVEFFDGFHFTPYVPLANPILLGSIDFTILTPVFDGLDDVEVFYKTGSGFTINGAIIQVPSEGPDLAPVPIPAAAWLLGSGLLGLIGVRRYRTS
jgi:hypothetical protein